MIVSSARSTLWVATPMRVADCDDGSGLKTPDLCGRKLLWLDRLPVFRASPFPGGGLAEHRAHHSARGGHSDWRAFRTAGSPNWDLVFNRFLPEQEALRSWRGQLARRNATK